MRIAMSSASACLGSRALAEFRNVVSHQRESGAGAGRQAGWTTCAALAAGDAFKPGKKITQKVGCPLQAASIDSQTGMHVHAQRGLRAAERARLVVLDRF